MSDKNAIRIQIDYDDGSQDFAEGEAATRIWRWYQDASAMKCIRGAKYDGPKFLLRKVVSAKLETTLQK